MSLSVLKENPESKILVILFGAIGDVVRGLGLATKIKKHYPASKIVWAVEKTSSALLRDHPSIDSLLIFDRTTGVSGYLSFLKNVRSQKCDITLDLSRHLKGGVCSILSGAPVRVGFSRKNSREGNWLFQTDHIPEVLHFSDKIMQFHKFAESLGISGDQEVDFGFALKEADIFAFEKKLAQICEESGVTFADPSRRVLFFIASTWESREWSSGYFAELATKLKEKFGMTPVIVGGPSDASKGDEILSALDDKSIALNLIGKTSLYELVILCKRSSCGVGVDSGPMHIASAAGLPVISFWGSTSPERSTPFGNKELVLQSPIGCAPCYFRECPGLDTMCLKNITPQIVLYKFEELFSRNQA